MERLLQDLAIDWTDVAFVGDDLNDIAVSKKVAWSACPSDAAEEMKRVSQYIALAKGGDGVISECVDFLMLF